MACIRSDPYFRSRIAPGVAYAAFYLHNRPRPGRHRFAESKRVIDACPATGFENSDGDS